MEEFDPIPRQKSLRSVGEHQDEILDLFTVPKDDKLVFRQTPWVIGSFLRGWQMDVPQGHPYGADPKAFLERARSQIRAKLKEELTQLCGIEFQLALKVQLREDNPDGSEEYRPCAAPQAGGYSAEERNQGGPQSRFPQDPRNAGDVDAERVGLGRRSGSDPLARHCPISASSRWVLHPTTTSGAT